MKIKRLEIGSFGKLKNYFLDLNDGFQILYGENEDGKSTIMNFIYLMFYGNAKVKTIHGVVNARKNYTPWDGSKMQGAVVFEFGDTEYRLEKIFGKSKATDIVTLLNNATGEKESINKGEDVGKIFFDMTDSAFEKSVFIGLVGAIGTDADISAKLANLVTSGDESVSPEGVIKRLLDGKYELISKSARAGKLVELEEKIDNLDDELKAAFAMEERRFSLEKQLELTNEQIQKLKNRKNRYIENNLLMQNYLEYEKVKAVIDQMENLDKGIKILRIPNTEIELETCSIPITRLNHIALKKVKIYIEEAISLRKDAESVSKIYHEKKNALSKDSIASVTEAEINTGRYLEKQLEMGEKISEYIDNLKTLEAELVKALKQKNMLDKLLTKYKQNQIKTTIDKKRERFSFDKTDLFLCSMTFLAFLLWGVFIHPVGYLVFAIVLILSMVVLFIMKKKRKQIEKKSEEENDTLDNKVEKHRLELKYIEDQITSLKTQIYHKRKKIQDMDKDFVLEIELSEYVEMKEKEYLRIKENLQDLLKEKNSSDLLELQSRHLEYMISKERKEELKSLELDVKKKELEFIEKISFFCKFAPDEFQDAVIELQNQENNLFKLQKQTEQIDNNLVVFGWNMLALNELMEKKVQIDAKLRDENGNLIPKIAEEEFRDQENNIEETEKLLEIAEEKMKELKFGQGGIHSKILDISEMHKKRKTFLAEQSKMKEYYDVLSIACESMEEASNELTGTFGPMVNDKTSGIFSCLTNGKYKNVSVSKKFDIRVLEEGDIISHESEYLSSGTIDQAYLSLRLAIAELISKDKNRLPILLDDVFMQYDDKRMKKGLEFLNDYSKEGRQIIYFTCHGNIIEQARKNNKEILFKNIQPRDKM